jgi:hypothetical protein
VPSAIINLLITGTENSILMESTTRTADAKRRVVRKFRVGDLVLVRIKHKAPIRNSQTLDGVPKKPDMKVYP